MFHFRATGFSFLWDVVLHHPATLPQQTATLSAGGRRHAEIAEVKADGAPPMTREEVISAVAARCARRAEGRGVKNPERLWYRTFNGKKWHIMAAQRSDIKFDMTLCGMEVGWTAGEKKPKRDLCRTCVTLSKPKRPR